MPCCENCRDGVVKSIIVEKVIHTKARDDICLDPPARNDDAVIQAIQKRLPNLYDDPISNCMCLPKSLAALRSAKGLKTMFIIVFSYAKSNID